MSASLQRSADSLAREHTEDAIAVVAAIMGSPACEPKDRLRAADMLLERGHGRPLSTTISIPASRKQRELLAKMSDEELIEQIQGAALPRLAQLTGVEGRAEPIIDGDYTAQEVVRDPGPIEPPGATVASQAEFDSLFGPGPGPSDADASPTVDDLRAQLLR